jgi:tetratricopeptide (TPR) repeat protein
LKSYRLQAQAGAIALDVYAKNPNHPGAAHYIIHAFDDPEHAILALPAARRYASIAPEAHHARHMPSHIFLQLGMWPEAAASNESAWQASEAWMKRKNLSLSVLDYHSLHWLLYVYLQQGRYQKAEELLSLMKKRMSESTYENKLRPGYYESNYASMAAAFVIETERWDLATKLFPASGDEGQIASTQSADGAHGAHGAQSIGTNGAMTIGSSNRGQRLSSFIRGYAAASSGSASRFADASMQTPAKGPEGINQLEVAALAASATAEHDKAIGLMTKAIEIEEAMGPPSGPPGVIKPAHESFGEILLRARKPDQAMQQFKAALLRQPNRARSLLGMARAAAQSGDRQAATSAYTKFLEQWKQADEKLPELAEAREFLTKR